MGGRPNLLQLWGSSASSGALVQPPAGIAGSGYPTGYRPPAEWFNWMFANYAEWLAFLRGANHEHWERVAWGTSPSTYDSSSPVLLAVDPDTADATGAAYRYVIAGWETSGPTISLRVSRRGNEWTRRTNVTTTTTLLPTALAHAPNPAASARWLLGVDDATIHYCTADAGGGTGPVGSGSGNWTSASITGGGTDVVAFAVKDAAALFALTIDGGLVSSDHGVTWTDYAGTSGTARSGNGSDCLWTGSAFVFVTTDGQIYASATAAGTFVYKTDLGGTATWRLATDGAGGVLAYRANNGSTLDLFWSADSGGTWETITPTSGFQRIQRIRHHEGTWLACSTVAPFLWASNDHESWTKLRMPVAGSDAALYDIAWDGGAWIVAGNGWVLQCPRGHDPSAADGVWTPGSTATRLIDAAYLRGREVVSTAPTNGQVLAWNNSAGYWEPTTVSGSSSPTTTRGDIIVRGASADGRLAIGASGRVLVSDGTDPAWVALTASHVSGVVPTTRTVAGLDLSTDRSAAALAAALAGRVIDTMAGTGWSATAAAGTAATWSTGPARLSLSVNAGVWGQAYVTHATLLPQTEEYDLCVRLDVVNGDGAAGTSGITFLRLGIDADHCVAVGLRSDGAMELSTRDGVTVVVLTAYTATAIDSTARTGGNLWIRVARRLGRVVVLWATGSSVPSVWTQFTDTTNTYALSASQGTSVTAGLYAANVTGGYGVDLTEIRATGRDVAL